jgi:hypothetical protein
MLHFLRIFYYRSKLLWPFSLLITFMIFEFDLRKSLQAECMFGDIRTGLYGIYPFQAAYVVQVLRNSLYSQNFLSLIV